MNDYFIDGLLELCEDNEVMKKAIKNYFDKNTIDVDLTDTDCEDIIRGGEFHWCFGGVNLHLFNSNELPEEL